MSPVEEVLAYWRRTKIPYAKGNNEKALITRETELDVVFSDTFREFYRATNGTSVPGAYGVDENGYDFYSLDRLFSYETVSWATVFCDYLDVSYWIEVDLQGRNDFGFEGGGVYVLGHARGALLMAKDLDEFFRLYVNDNLYGFSEYHELALSERSSR